MTVEWLLSALLWSVLGLGYGWSLAMQVRQIQIGDAWW